MKIQMIFYHKKILRRVTELELKIGKMNFIVTFTILYFASSFREQKGDAKQYFIFLRYLFSRDTCFRTPNIIFLF